MKLTFAFFKFKVPNFKQFLWNIGASNMSESYRDAKAVLDIVKSCAWGFFKFRVSGEDIDKSFVHCKLCLVEVEPKPKKRKMLELDFDNESDEDGDQDDALDAELRRFEIKF